MMLNQDGWSYIYAIPSSIVSITTFFLFPESTIFVDFCLYLHVYAFIVYTFNASDYAIKRGISSSLPRAIKRSIDIHNTARFSRVDFQSYLRSSLIHAIFSCWNTCSLHLLNNFTVCYISHWWWKIHVAAKYLHGWYSQPNFSKRYNRANVYVIPTISIHFGYFHSFRLFGLMNIPCDTSHKYRLKQFVQDLLMQ